MKRLRQFLAAVPGVVFATILALVAAEVVARQVLIRLPPPVADIYLLDQTDAQLRALYNGADPVEIRAMLEETWRKGVPLVYSPFVEFVSGARAGRFVNVAADGYRFVPPDVPLAEPGRKVFVFGGSTVFGMGVADAQTVPARIGAELAGRDAKAAVYNFGTNFYYSTQSRILFERLLLRGHRPDVAVFIDGLNDFYFCAAAEQTALSPEIARVLREPVPPTLRVLAQRSNTLRLVRRLADPAPGAPEAPATPECSDAEIEAVVRRIDFNRREVAAVAAAFGVRVVFVQQPVPTYAFDPARRAAPVPPAQLVRHLASERGYPRLLAERDAGRLHAQDVLWLETEAIPQNMYVDAVHYSPEFAAHLAARIAPAVADRLPR